MRLVGMGKAKEIIFSARNVKAAEALEIGLVNAVHSPEELLPADTIRIRITRDPAEDDVRSIVISNA